MTPVAPRHTCQDQYPGPHWSFFSAHWTLDFLVEGGFSPSGEFLFNNRINLPKEGLLVSRETVKHDFDTAGLRGPGLSHRTPTTVGGSLVQSTGIHGPFSVDACK